MTFAEHLINPQSRMLCNKTMKSAKISAGSVKDSTIPEDLAEFGTQAKT